jgi:hypothetical protein
MPGQYKTPAHAVEVPDTLWDLATGLAEQGKA